MMLTIPIFIHSKTIQTEGMGSLEQKGNQLILHLEGSPYEMGFQHGKLLKDKVRLNITNYLENNNASEQVSLFKQNIPTLISHIPSYYLEEMRGLAEGAELAFNHVLLLNLFPEMFHCMGLTVKDELTTDGSLYHVRALDYAVGKGLQHTNVLIFCKPENGHSFANISYAGFIGAISGMNDEHLSVGEIGGKGYGKWDGIPMSFLLREILQFSSNLEDAKEKLRRSPRTCEYFYVIADGKINQSIGAYATNSQITFIEPGSSYYLSDCADYSFQAVSSLFCEDDLDRIFFQQPKDSIALIGFSNPERYTILTERLDQSKGLINARVLQEIIKQPVGRKTNLHNVIFHPGSCSFWVSHAGYDDSPAYSEPYQHFQLPCQK